MHSRSWSGVFNLLKFDLTPKKKKKKNVRGEAFEAQTAFDSVEKPVRSLYRITMYTNASCCCCLLPVVIDRSLLSKVSQTVQHGLENSGFCDFQGRWAFIVTWYNVSTSSNSSQVQTTF